MEIPALPHRTPSWRLFTGLLLAVYCLRGIMLACIIPPLEMWDEFQHVAYIEFIGLHHRIPVLGQAQVSRPLMEAVIHLPQGRLEVSQIAAYGAVDYERYWKATLPIQYVQPIPRQTIYEAQHPPIYYWLMVPFYRAAGGPANLIASVSVLRLVNVFISAIGIAVFLWWLNRACLQIAHAMLIGAAVALQPLFLLNACRVANDALAVTLGIILIVWLLSVSGRRLLWHALGIGALLGIAVMTKATDMIILPFAGMVLLALCIRRQTTWLRAAGAFAALCSVLTIETFPYFRFTFEQYHLFVPMGEAVVNRRNNVPLQNYLHWIGPEKWTYWLSCIRGWFIDDGIWVGGWSFLRPALIFPRLYGIVVWSAVAAWPLAWLFRRRKAKEFAVFKPGPTVPLALALCLCMVAGMLVHGVVSAQIYNQSSAEPWYSELVVPWFVALVSVGALVWRFSRVGYGLAAALPILFVVTELYGAWSRMVYGYSQRKLSLSALRRLATLHPDFLGIPTLFLSTGLMLALLVVAAMVCLKTLREVPAREA